MDTDRLHEYLTVVNAQNMTRAAGLLNMAQPTLSKHIAELESMFGTQLLERLPTGVRPTYAGRILYNGAADVLGRIEELKETMRRAKDIPQCRLNIACYVGYAPTDDLMDAAAERLTEEMPGALVNVVDLCTYQGDCFSDLDHGLLDACLTVAPADLLGRSLGRRPLLNDRLAIVVRSDNPLADRHDVTVDAIRGEVLWLLNTPGQPYIEAIRELLAHHGLSPSSYTSEFYVGTTRGDVLNVGKGGCGLSLLGMGAKPASRAYRRAYAIRPISSPGFELAVEVLYRTDCSEATRAFIHLLEEEAQELTAECSDVPDTCR